MAMGLEELATKGPIRPDALRGLENLDEYVKMEDLTVINGLKEMPPKTGVREVKDPTFYRTGWLLSEEMCK
jgi:cilia- and flagella-associated protein 298